MCQDEIMEERLGLRERKKAQTRRRIEDAALELFARDGFDEATVEAIASAADISPRTFFYYFAAKEDVVLADYAGRLDRIIQQLAMRPPTETPWEALRASFLVVAADYETERAGLIRRFRIIAGTPSVHARSLQLQSGWEDTVTATLAERMNREPQDLIPRLLAASALAAIRSSLQNWIATESKSSLPELVNNCFTHLESGLARVS